MLIGDFLYVVLGSTYKEECATKDAKRCGLLVLDRNTGEEIYQFRTSSGVPSPPIVIGGCVYFADIGGTIYVLPGCSTQHDDSDDSVPLGTPEATPAT